MVSDELEQCEIVYQGFRKIDAAITLYPKMTFNNREERIELERRIPLARISDKMHPGFSGNYNSAQPSEKPHMEINNRFDLADSGKDLSASLLCSLDKSRYSLESILKDLGCLSYFVEILRKSDNLSLTPEQSEKFKKITKIQRTITENVPVIRNVIMQTLWERQLKQIYIYMSTEGIVEDKSTLPPIEESMKIALESIQNPEAYRKTTQGRKRDGKALDGLNKKILSNKYNLHRWKTSELVWGITKLQKKPKQSLNQVQAKTIESILKELEVLSSKTNEVNSLRKGLFTVQQKRYLKKYIIDNISAKKN